MQLEATRYILVVDVDPKAEQHTDVSFENMGETLSYRLDEME